MPRWLKIFLIWTLFGLLTAVQTHYRYAFGGRPDFGWWRSVAAEVSFAWIWAALTPIVLWLAVRLPLAAKNWWRNALVHMVAAVVLGILSKALWDATILGLLMDGKTPATFEAAIKMALLSLDYGILQYGLVLVTQQAMTWFRKSEQERVRASQLEADLARAQLQALKMQLHPHFLFNTLNTISELIDTDPDTAERMVVQLSDFLRLTLDTIGIPEVPLMVELDFLRRYLDIEKLRFEDRLEVGFDIEPAALHGRVPNLILQPIVENALKHGLSAMPGVARLNIHSHIERGQLSLLVTDNGPGLKPHNGTPMRQGVGISNTRRRLQQAYGADHRFTMRNRPEGGCEVTIQVPLRLSAN